MSADDPNANRPGYKETTVGWIPEEWDVVRLKRAVNSIESGTSVTGGSGPPETGQIGVLKVSAVTSGTFFPLESKTVTDAEAERVRCPVTSDSILVNRANGSHELVGSAAKVETAHSNLFLPDKIWKLTANREFVDVDFLLAIVKSARFRQKVIDLSSGGTGMMNISSKAYLSVFVPFPFLPEQKKIAEILSTCDEMIDKTGALIEAKKRQKRALMQQLLTGRKRLSGFAAGAWEAHRLGDLFDERTEANPDHLPLLAITATRGIIPASEIDRKDSSSADKSRYKVIHPGDIGYNTMRMWQGVSAVSKLHGIVSPAYTICIPSEKVDVDFMGYFFRFSPTVYLFWRFSQGLVNDTLNLKFPNFSVIPVNIPRKDEQREIAKVLRSADEEIDALERKLSALKQQKRALMQKLLTGQVRVKDRPTTENKIGQPDT